MSISNHTLILKNDSTLWGCGDNQYGQLGLENVFSSTTFTQITGDIKSVCCGGNHTLVLQNNGTLWGCGWNGYGQLGLGDTSSRNTLTQITTNVDNIKSIYSDSYHTFILKNNGTLWGCGYNGYGQLGLGEDVNNKTTFTQIVDVYDVKSIYCGFNHTIILKNDGTLWGCGQNNNGQLGLGDATNRKIFIKITDDVKSVNCGHDYTLILKNDSTLWGCGDNSVGQLGLGDKTSRTTFTQITDNVKSIYCGKSHTIILKNDGTLWGCGDNQYGQLGLEGSIQKTMFTPITTNTDNVKSVYCGYYHTLILKNDSTLWGCGYNKFGQLGLGDGTDKTTFTKITTNVDSIKSFVNDCGDFPSVIKIYDTKVGYVETLDTNNFRNIPINSVERLKSLCANPLNTHLNCLISFDKKQTWKTFDGLNWSTISDISPENIIVNGMALKDMNQLDRNKLISGGFTGDLDFKIAMKTNNVNKTPSVTKIYIEYK